MKARTNLILILLLLLLLVSGSLAKDPDPLVLHGAIMDSQCAYNVHSLARSHDWMIRKNVAGAKDAKTCTLHCVRERGGVYVLLVKQEVYRLDDQVQTEIYSGKNVKVTGTLDEKTHTLHVLRMEEDK
jgi:hypothetical protein